MKPLTFDTLMALDEQTIRQSFPSGATKGARGWIPATEKPDRSLDELLSDKEARMERLRYMRASYSVPRKYLREAERQKDPKDGENDNYTYLPSKAVKEPEGAEPALPRAVQEQQSRDAEQRFIAEQGRRYGMDAQRGNMSLAERLKRIEEYAQPHQLESIERRIAGLERSLHERAA